MSLAVEQPQGYTGASLGCSRARDILAFLPPNKTTCSFPYRFSGDNRNSLLCPLSRECLWIFSSNLRGNFALKNGGDFFCSGLLSHEMKNKNSSKNSGKIRSKIRGKIRDKNSKKFGEFSFCNFSDLRIQALYQAIGISRCATLALLFHYIGDRQPYTTTTKDFQSKRGI